jgi:hypothetical protein
LLTLRPRIYVWLLTLRQRIYERLITVQRTSREVPATDHFGSHQNEADVCMYVKCVRDVNNYGTIHGTAQYYEILILYCSIYIIISAIFQNVNSVNISIRAV